MIDKVKYIHYVKKDRTAKKKNQSLLQYMLQRKRNKNWNKFLIFKGVKLVRLKK